MNLTLTSNYLILQFFIVFKPLKFLSRIINSPDTSYYRLLRFYHDSNLSNSRTRVRNLVKFSLANQHCINVATFLSHTFKHCGNISKRNRSDKAKLRLRAFSNSKERAIRGGWREGGEIGLFAWNAFKLEERNRAWTHWTQRSFSSPVYYGVYIFVHTIFIFYWWRVDNAFVRWIAPPRCVSRLRWSNLVRDFPFLF